jgi:hypothetical protein
MNRGKRAFYRPAASAILFVVVVGGAACGLNPAWGRSSGPWNGEFYSGGKSVFVGAEVPFIDNLYCEKFSGLFAFKVESRLFSINGKRQNPTIWTPGFDTIEIGRGGKFTLNKFGEDFFYSAWVSADIDEEDVCSQQPVLVKGKIRSEAEETGALQSSQSLFGNASASVVGSPQQKRRADQEEVEKDEKPVGDFVWSLVRRYWDAAMIGVLSGLIVGWRFSR